MPSTSFDASTMEGEETMEGDADERGLRLLSALERLRDVISTERAAIRIKVPNDFSPGQEMVVRVTISNGETGLMRFTNCPQGPGDEIVLRAPASLPLGPWKGEGEVVTFSLPPRAEV